MNVPVKGPVCPSGAVLQSWRVITHLSIYRPLDAKNPQEGTDDKGQQKNEEEDRQG